MPQTIAQFARQMRGFAGRLERNIIAAERVSANEGLRSAIKWSRGRLSAALLARYGHFYAARNPQPPQDPAIINRQTGLFASSWEVRGPVRIAGDALRTTVVNMAPYSGFMRGTVKMIPRPIVQRVEQEVAGRRLTRLQRAIERAWAR